MYKYKDDVYLCIHVRAYMYVCGWVNVGRYVQVYTCVDFYMYVQVYTSAGMYVYVRKNRPLSICMRRQRDAILC